MSRLGIAGRKIGNNEPCFIIAEAGVNHNGDVNLAKKLIEVAEEAGADAVKLQTFKAEEMATKNAEKAAYQKEITGTQESQYEMLKKLELSEEEHVELKRYADEQGILLLSTPYDNRSVDFLVELGVPALKVSSADITSLPLLYHIASKGLPIILSTGMSTLGEVEEAIEVIANSGNQQIILLHCVSCYPTKIEDMNLRAMETLRCVFNLPVGLSDHSIGITVPIAAAALGACIIEKHFTLDKNLPGPDHRASLEPKELKQMVKAIRDVQKAMGDGIKKPTMEEEENKKVVRRGIVALTDILQGTTLTVEMLDIKRPVAGIEAKHLATVVGKKVRKDIAKDSPLTWDKIRMKNGQ